jgi:hypothetical protein
MAFEEVFVPLAKTPLTPSGLVLVSVQTPKLLKLSVSPAIVTGDVVGGGTLLAESTTAPDGVPGGTDGLPLIDVAPVLPAPPAAAAPPPL